MQAASASALYVATVISDFLVSPSLVLLLPLGFVPLSLSLLLTRSGEKNETGSKEDVFQETKNKILNNT